MITRMFGGTFLVTLCGILIGALPISVLAGKPSVVQTTGAFNWNTRVASLRFNSCKGGAE